jgi:GPH family glycoside/pentoside/hexuronide:cation symporter
MGRRRPYFLLGAVPFGIAFLLLWRTPFEGQNAMTLYYLVVYVSLCLSMTVLSVPYMALIPEWSRDFDERTSINTFRSGFAVLGTMVAASIPAVTDSLGGGAPAYATMAVFLSIWVTIPWLAVFWVSEEATDRPLPRRESGILEGLRTLRAHGTYVRLCGIYVSARIAVDLLGLAVPLYLTEWMLRKEDISPVLLSMLVVVVLSLPIWLQVSRRFDKHRIFVAGAMWFGASLLFIWFVQPEWPHWIMFAAAGLTGVGYAVADLMPWAMLGEVIDEDQLLTGERREGVYNGVFTFLRKAGGASAYGVAGLALSVAGYEASLGTQQKEEVLIVIRSLTTLIPACFLLISVLLALPYTLGRERHTEILAALERANEDAATDRDDSS